jgi:hypothetical protein
MNGREGADALRGRVTEADRDVFRRYGEIERLPPTSPPPPRTLQQLCAWMEKWCRPEAPLHGDDEEAVARLTRMRNVFLARDAKLAGDRGGRC